MASIRYFVRTDNPAQFKAFIDDALRFNIDLEHVESINDWVDWASSPKYAVKELDGWYEWYTYADGYSFEHCLFCAVIESCAHLYADIREQYSVSTDSWWQPGQGMEFDRSAYLNHLVKYKDSSKWSDDEGNSRLPYPDEVVQGGYEPPDYLRQFRLVV